MPGDLQFNDSDRRLVEIFKRQLSKAETTLAALNPAFPKQSEELRSYIIRCKQLLMDMRYLKAVSEIETE